MSLRPRKKKITKSDLKKLHEQRTERAQHMDEKFKAKLAPSNEAWAKEPGRYDSKGIDYPEKHKRKLKGGKRMTPQKDLDTAQNKIFEQKIKDAVTKEQVDSVVGEALGYAVYHDGFTKKYLKDIKELGVKQKKELAKKPVSYSEQLRKDTGIETMQAFIKMFDIAENKKGKDKFLKAKTLGELNEVWMAKNFFGSPDFRKSLLESRGIILDASKSIGVAPKHSLSFPKTQRYKEIELNLRTLPEIRISEITVRDRKAHKDKKKKIKVIDIKDKKGRKIVTFKSGSLEDILKMTKKFDMKWYVDGQKPLIGINQKTGEQVFIAPYLEH